VGSPFGSVLTNNSHASIFLSLCCFCGHAATLKAIELEDPLFWLRDDSRNNPEVLNLIKEENRFTEARTRHSKPFQQKIYADLLRHMKQTDVQVPYLWGEHYYYSRTVEGKSYGYVCRRCGSMDAPEEIVLDLNALAKGQKYLDVGEWSPAPPAHALLAYSVDTTGYEVRREVCSMRNKE